MSSTPNMPFDAAFSTALLQFNNEALGYCNGISDEKARDYAVLFARVLQSHAKGLQPENLRVPFGLFGPNKTLIETTLKRMFYRYFPTARQI